jgi:site-specific recombinase XerD
LVNSGRGLYEVQRLLGHAHIKTTQRYAHLSDETLISAANTAGSFMPGAVAKLLVPS